ncbi:aspartate/tyrosine/aromatic aminotransferase [Rhizobium sp. P40RR-XXII]|uniref:aromatic amino acid transaminase n=1 Tax=unclassified Rhizobium TaxID=2613769 RepID=UPI00145716C5|nr:MULTISPECIES: aromatic amino acid transaminase [unclassified Rhizobium]NLR89337.1 aspartate/tyrosine/aromatic aminotransferase [Rhizobium sp. P28RR-XV]NLS21199.1 aspartate/tyrosine/aromatic aminotransferase [Rhizobium sp. P40RR-XXII]
MNKTAFFDSLTEQKPDPLLELIAKFAADPRPGKVDLGVGVYRDETGRTPVMKAVKTAEHYLWETQESKSYIGPEGDPLFLRTLAHEVFGGRHCGRLLAGIQTPGGTGALRLAAELLALDKRRKIWIGTPTWVNHQAIFAAVGLQAGTYRFFDIGKQAVLIDDMLTALQNAAPGDAVLLQTSCHNPTGAALSQQNWRDIADIAAARGLLPLFDNAYQGLGHGRAEDAAGMMMVIEAVGEAMVAVSCSKSFSLYRERTGAVYLVGDRQASLNKAIGNLAGYARASYSMPPAHGAAIVAAILQDASRRQAWMDELNDMRIRITEIRRAAGEAFGRFRSELAHIGAQEGMFSLLPISPENVRKLRAEHGIYMPDSGRINVAGMRVEDVASVTECIGPYLA